MVGREIYDAFAGEQEILTPVRSAHLPATARSGGFRTLVGRHWAIPRDLAKILRLSHTVNTPR
jgi:hypothetical protein